ncbi:MAG: DUF1800 domain-containing protein [Acidobacteriota bacterium]
MEREQSRHSLRSRRRLVADLGSPAPALRRAQSVPAAGTAPPLPPLAVIVLNRLAFGPRPADIAAFNNLGPNDDARLTAWVDQQLNPGAITDPNADARIAAAGYVTLDKSRTELWDEHFVNAPDFSFRALPFEETERVTMLRMVYSRRQLLEVMTDFWHNHFNVYGRHGIVLPMMVHYDRDVIRGNVFGNFRQMLEDVGRSTAMLYYLDNYTSSNAGPNENYSRELFEIHAMGRENYLGVRQQNEVPTDGMGRPIGYVDADVYEATRCFTGWTVSNSSSDTTVGNTGAFYYRADWHDRFQKTVLGEFIPADQPALKDGEDVYDALAAHPGTGRYIAGKLCRRLIGENAPQSIIDQAAALFTAQAAAPDQLKQVVRTIILSDAFKNTWGGRVKRPTEIAAGTMRTTRANLPFRMGESDTSTLLGYLRDAGHRLFYWPAPDGYSDDKDDWMSATPRVGAWRVCNWLTDVTDDGGVHRMNVVGETPAGVRSANALADYWINRILGRPMTAASRQEVVEFMAAGRNPDLDLPLDTSETTEDRLRSMIGLIVLAPDFLWS